MKARHVGGRLLGRTLRSIVYEKLFSPKNHTYTETIAAVSYYTQHTQKQDTFTAWHIPPRDSVSSVNVVDLQKKAVTRYATGANTRCGLPP